MSREAPPIAVSEIASAEDAEQVAVTGRITPQRSDCIELSPLLVLVRHDLGQRALAHSVVDEVTMPT